MSKSFAKLFIISKHIKVFMAVYQSFISVSCADPENFYPGGGPKDNCGFFLPRGEGGPRHDCDNFTM